MTNSTTTPIHGSSNQGYARNQRKSSDAAPMVITRLSGWIDIGEVKTEARGWIIPTRLHTPVR
jgi:hypothetical protein